MIFLYSGTPGSGKSCHAAREIALRLQRKDSVVIGNFYFNTKAVKKCCPEPSPGSGQAASVFTPVIKASRPQAPGRRG